MYIFLSLSEAQMLFDVEAQNFLAVFGRYFFMELITKNAQAHLAQNLKGVAPAHRPAGSTPAFIFVYFSIIRKIKQSCDLK